MAVPPIGPGGVHHVAIQCRDLEGMVRFYHKVLRLPIVQRWASEEGGPPGERSVWVGCGRGVIALERCRGAVTANPWRSDHPGLHLLALQIFLHNRDKWHDWLDHHGVPVVSESRWTLYIEDPEGNRIGLSHYPQEAEPVA